MKTFCNRLLLGGPHIRFKRNRYSFLVLVFLLASGANTWAQTSPRVNPNPNYLPERMGQKPTRMRTTRNSIHDSMPRGSWYLSTEFGQGFIAPLLGSKGYVATPTFSVLRTLKNGDVLELGVPLAFGRDYSLTNGYQNMFGAGLRVGYTVQGTRLRVPVLHSFVQVGITQFSDFAQTDDVIYGKRETFIGEAVHIPLVLGLGPAIRLPLDHNQRLMLDLGINGYAHLSFGNRTQYQTFDISQQEELFEDLLLIGGSRRFGQRNVYANYLPGLGRTYNNNRAATLGLSVSVRVSMRVGKLKPVPNAAP